MTMIRTASITLGDLSLTVTYEATGAHCRATMTDPEERPEIELQALATDSGEDVSGLLQFGAAYDTLLEQVTEHDREASEPDPDEAYDRWRDEQMARDDELARGWV